MIDINLIIWLIWRLYVFITAEDGKDKANEGFEKVSETTRVGYERSKDAADDAGIYWNEIMPL